jgi:recombination protein RecA
MEQQEKWQQFEKNLNKQLGTENIITRLGNRVGIPIESIPTGLPSFDRIVSGTGGIPRGRVIEMYGPESSGKTTFALHIVAKEQKSGKTCAYIDMEHSLDPSWMATLGVNVDELVVSQPDFAEQALEIVASLVESSLVSLIVIDSVSSLVPKSELEGDFGESHMGLQARLLSQAMRKLVGLCSKNGVSLIFINQIRSKIGISYGSPEVTSGGNALKFYASIRLDLRRKEYIKENDEIVGQQIRVKAVKNKISTPFKECLIDLNYSKGFDEDSDLISYAIQIGIITQSGGWLSFKDTKYRRDDLIEVVEEVRKAVNESSR